jgi:hypothetical protein
MFEAGFLYHNIQFKRYGTEPWIIAKGEIVNNSRKHYSSTLFKITIFHREQPVWSGAIKIRNFKRTQRRSFELLMEGLDYRLLPEISKYEIYFESGY